MVLLEVQHISKQIDGNIIVADISFKQEVLQKIAIAGESGAGKTTLLKMISGHAQPTGGTILFDGERVIGPDEKLLPGHKQIAYLSQDHDLLHNYRVEELIWFENHLSHDEAATLFEVCQVDHLLKRRTDQLSGGEKQRIALCMLLIKSPKLLVLDEPFSNLDLIHKGVLKTVIEDIGKKLQITCLLTSHDPHDTLSWADEIIVMKEGKIVQQGTPEEIYNRPINEYAAGMFGKYNLLKPHIALLFGIKSKDNDVMTRPEHFTISATGSGVKGIIQKIGFWGGFYEADVLVEDVKIVVRMMKNEWEVGKKILLNVAK
jgi:ABC-type Fe3+/spermidine/putrescine transport system ATPase subunit